MYSAPVEAILRASGWSPDRAVCTSDWLRQLENEGFKIVPQAATILEQFGGLVIRPQKAADDTFVKGVLNFDPVMAASGEFERINYWQQRLLMQTTPIGEGSKGDILLIAEDGTVFICYEDQLFWISPSFEDALENSLIIAKRKAVEFGRMKL